MNILIADDHALFREGLCHVLQELNEQVNILEAADYDSAMQVVSATPNLDLALLDLNMPGKDGFTGLDTFSKEYPTIPFVVLSASSQQSDIQRSIDAGAVGYIPKESTSSVMLSALKLIMAGGIYIPQTLTQQSSHKQNKNNIPDLTPRQLDVLKMIMRGHSNKVIAADLNISEATIKMHVTAIFKTLGVSNRTQAAMVAESSGLFTFA